MSVTSKARRSELIGYLLVAGSVYLGWEMLKPPIVDRAPPEIAVRLASNSPRLLRRAGEEELAAGRAENAAALADGSLSRAPFNARALRVRGLATARLGDAAQADDMLTLAGNWSLRDDQAHAWLMEQRLKRGDYVSAFGHGDTLLRRRTDLYPQVFRLLTIGGLQSPAALRPLGALLAANPPWRRSYWSYLSRFPNGDALMLSLAVGLKTTDHPLDAEELSWLYDRWAQGRRFDAMRLLRDRLDQPARRPLVVNGDFTQALDAQMGPLGWTLGYGSGLTAEVTEDDDRAGNNALRVQYDGRGRSEAASQLLLLPPGRYRLTYRVRVEQRSREAGLDWVLTCADSDQVVAQSDAAPERAGGWVAASMPIVVPQDDCAAQRLSLKPRRTDRKAPLAVWFDDVVLTPTSTDARQ